jgi:sulfatase maturation enzyme AslB (radical SAM superfamily)
VPLLQWPKPGDPLTVILKVAGSRCNLDCLYCYDKRRDLADSGYLNPEHLRKLTRLARGHPLNVTFHGGEPLVVPDWRLATYFDVLSEHDAPVVCGIVTNGTLLTRSRCESLRSLWPSIQFAVSYDGPNDMSRYRVDYLTRVSADRAERAMYVLDDMGVRYAVMTVATNALKGQEIRLLERIRMHKGVSTLKILPCFDFDVTQSHSGSKLRTPASVEAIKQSKGLAEWAISPSGYAELLRRLAHEWRDAGDYRSFILEPIISIIMSLAGGDSGFTDFSTRKHAHIVVLSPSGELSTSDEFETNLARIGHIDALEAPISEAIVESPIQLWRQVGKAMNKCASGCPVEHICRGGNLPDRIALSTSDDLDREYCNSRIQMISDVQALVAGLPGQ